MVIRYADRILLHSLPDMAPHLTLHNYELCDSLTASDHRPVSAVLHLHVAAARHLHRRSVLAYYQGPPPLPASRHVSRPPLPALAPSPAAAMPPLLSPSLGRSVSDNLGAAEPSEPEPPPLHPSHSSPPPRRKASTTAPPTSHLPPAIKSSSSGVLIVTLRLSDLRLDLLSDPSARGGAHEAPPMLPPAPLPPLKVSGSFSSSNSGGQSAATAPASSREPRRLLMAFPLPSENLMERSERQLEYLHSELDHGWAVWSSDNKDVLRGTAVLGLEEAQGPQGVAMSAAVRVGGVLHAAIKLLDASGKVSACCSDAHTCMGRGVADRGP